VAPFEESGVRAQQPEVAFDAIHKLPRAWRYFNISVLWIFYYPSVIRLLYSMRIRHEIVTFASIGSGLVAAWLIVDARSLSDFLIAALFVHLKDVFDACDGALARITGTGHRAGRFLDTIGDGIVFTAWIAACAFRMTGSDVDPVVAGMWGVAAWLSLFLQCSYFNFHQLHYVRLSGAELTSRLDEREELARGFIAALGWVYQIWFGWQDRLIAWFDGVARTGLGLPRDSIDSRNDAWYTYRPLMIANSALCFGTHAFVLIICLAFQSPEWFLPVVAVGMNIYWLGIVLARQVVFRRGT